MCFWKESSASGFFVYILISICTFIYLDFSYAICQAGISNVHVSDINLFCFGTMNKTISSENYGWHSCVYLGILISIIKSEKLVVQNLQKPHCCNLREKENKLLQQKVLTISFFAQGLFPLQLTVTHI